MMTKQEVSAEYKLTDRGTVASPGKFEGEPWYVVALWFAALDGGSDLDVDGAEDEPIVSFFKVDEALIASLGLSVDDLPSGEWVGVWEDDRGFVNRVTRKTDPGCSNCEGAGCNNCDHSDPEA